jgi:hypothetical protein
MLFEAWPSEPSLPRIHRPHYQGVIGMGADVLATTQGVIGMGADVLAATQGVIGMGADVFANV